MYVDTPIILTTSYLLFDHHHHQAGMQDHAIRITTCIHIVACDYVLSCSLSARSLRYYFFHRGKFIVQMQTAVKIELELILSMLTNVVYYHAHTLPMCRSSYLTKYVILCPTDSQRDISRGNQ